MCGRYRRTTQEEELARLYHIPIPKQTDLPISYNIAPSQKVLTIRFNPETQQPSLDVLQWGLIPYWPTVLMAAKTYGILRQVDPLDSSDEVVGPFGINVAISANGHRASKPEVASVAARQGLLRPVPYSTHCRSLR